jgi:lysine-N-methylase
MQPSYSAYAQKFRCIGSECEDTCCAGWNVPVDEPTYKKYQELPAGPFRTLICESVAKNDPPAGTDPATPVIFAQIRMNSENQCPMLSGERLCRVQVELGHEMLGHTCATYPRIVHQAGGLKETALTLSCPEAARLVLLSPELLSQDLPTSEVQQTHVPLETGSAKENIQPLPPDFVAIRESVLAIIEMRSYPLWQRIFLVGLMCRRLDSIAQGESGRTASEFLASFKTVVAAGSLRASMETLPVDRAAQLDIVLRLAGLMLNRSNVTPRFAASIQAFTSGIGNGPGATLESLTSQYTLAYDTSFEPFFRQHPYILENYLINTIVRCQFPFGKDGMAVGAVPQMEREFAKLTAQFALVRGLLIGVAGFHRRAFSSEHVVMTVQSAAKHFEHHPEFLKLAHELLVESQMDGAKGTAILLRNAGQDETASPAVSEPASDRTESQVPPITPGKA